VRQKKKSVNGAAAVGDNEKLNQEQLEKHSPIIHSRSLSAISHLGGVSSAPILLQML